MAYISPQLGPLQASQTGSHNKKSGIFATLNIPFLLNIALFGKTATEWRNENPDKKGENIRDYATIEQLLVLANLENTNALLIEQGLPPELRLKKLNEIAIQQLTTLTKNKSVEKLKALDGKPQLPDENNK